MTGIIILYLFCLIRLAVPVELPWTKVVSGGSLYNFLYQIFGCEITCVAGHEIYVYHIFVVAWGVVMAVLLTRYLIQYHRVVSYFSEMEKTEDTELNNILDEICTDKEKRNIKIVQTAAVEVPCCMGIFEKRILIPDKKYSREELHYIILHEYTHLDNKDILTIQLINILCIVFWWNPFVYILKGDMYQSIEIRCDQTVTKKLKSAERGNYLTVILKEYKASVQEKEFRKPAGAMPLFEDHSDHLIERFRLVAEGKQSSSRIGRILVPVIAVALLVLSYSIILQSRYEVPESTYGLKGDSLEINQKNAYMYEKNGEYYLHCEEGNFPIDKKTVKLLEKNEFNIRKGGR
jgi:antirepressor regulating drug resistance, predicted signal transduction N-terminal membrane component